MLAPAPAPAPAIAPAPAAPAPIQAIMPNDDMPTFGQAYERNIQLRLTAWQTNARGRSSSEMQWRSKYKELSGGRAWRYARERNYQPHHARKYLNHCGRASRLLLRIFAVILTTFLSGQSAWNISNSNPVIKAKKALGGKPRKNGRIHHEAIAHKDAAQFYAGIENVSGMATAKNALRFVILTAARKEEVLAAKWGEIDFKAQDVDYSRGARRAHEKWH